MKVFKWVITLGLVGYACSGVSPIKPDERGLVRRFGKIVATPGPGLWIGMPVGIDRLDRVSVLSVRQSTIGLDEPAILVTGDQNLIAATIVVGYAVDPQSLDRYILHQDTIETTIASLGQSLATEWAAARAIDDALIDGRVRLSAYLSERLPARLLRANLGVVIQQVGVQSLSPPEDVREAFTQVNEAQATMQTAENRARQDALRRIRDAETLANRIRSEAESRQNEAMTTAKADAEMFTRRLTAFRAIRSTNPDVLGSIWWEETGRMLLGIKGKGRIDLLDSHLGPNGLDFTTILPPAKR
jgi:membrane protease subunit HflK